MKKINIGHGAAAGICDAVKALTDGKKGAHGHRPDRDTRHGRGERQGKILALLKAEYEVEWLVISEPDSIVHATPRTPKRSRRILRASTASSASAAELSATCANTPTYYYNKGNPLPLVIVQTALSVNAFSDNSSVMLFNGVKRTVHSRYPLILIIDMDIIAAAPAEMNVSGYGDLIATWTAPVDWYLGNVLGVGKNFTTAPSDMIRTQCEELLENSRKLAAGDSKVLGDLANVLTLSGLSMGLADESSPGLRFEHVMSHLIDMASKVRATPASATTVRRSRYRA